MSTPTVPRTPPENGPAPGSPECTRSLKRHPSTDVTLDPHIKCGQPAPRVGRAASGPATGLQHRAPSRTFHLSHEAAASGRPGPRGGVPRRGGGRCAQGRPTSARPRPAQRPHGPGHFTPLRIKLGPSPQGREPRQGPAWLVHSHTRVWAQGTQGGARGTDKRRLWSCRLCTLVHHLRFPSARRRGAHSCSWRDSRQTRAVALEAAPRPPPPRALPAANSSIVISGKRMRASASPRTFRLFSGVTCSCCR